MNQDKASILQRLDRAEYILRSLVGDTIDDLDDLLNSPDKYLKKIKNTISPQNSFNNSKYKALVEACAQIIWSTNTEGIAVEDSPSWREFTGQSYEEMLGHGWLDVIHPDEQERVINLWKEYVNKKKTVSFSYRVKHISGEWRWMAVRAAPIREEDGSVSGWVGINTDITQHKKTDEQYARQNELLKKILDKIPVFIVQYDPHQNNFTFNEYFRQISGWTEADTIDGKFMEKAYPDPELRQAVSDYMASLEPGWMDMVTTAKDGTEIDCSWSNIQLSDDTVIGIGIDIRERKQAINALQESEDKLRRLLQQTPAIISIVEGPGHKFIFANDLCCKTIRNRDIIGKPLREAFPDLEGQGLFEEFDHVYQTGELITDEEMLIKLDQNNGDQLVEGYFNKNLAPWYDENGNIAGVMSFSLDVTEQVKARKALAESEERFRTLANNISQFAWMADPTGWIYWYNKRWYDYTGTTLDEAKGWGWKKVHHPSHVSRVIKKLAYHIEHGIEWEDTFPIRSKDGEYRWFLSRAIPIYDDEGHITQWFGTNTDITEHKKVEEALAESEERFRSAFRHAPIGMALKTVEGKYLHVNDAYCNIVGYSKEALLNSNITFQDLTHPEELNQNIEGYKKLIDREIPAFFIEKRYIRSDNQPIWVLNSATIYKRGTDNKPIIVSLVEDISKRKQAEADLRDSEKLFHDAFRLAPVGMVLSTPDGHFLQVNDAFCNITGYSREELIEGEITFIALTHPDDLEKNLEVHKQMLEGKIPAFFYEKRYIRKDGNIVWVKASATLHTKGDKNTTLVVGQVEDITERKKSEAALIEADRKKDEFLATLGHELRNPLAALAIANNMLKKNNSPERRHQAEDIISRQIDQMRTLVDDLLDVSRVTLGKINLNKTYLDVHKQIQLASKSVQSRAESKSIQLTINNLNGSAYIYGDSVRIQQIFTNILSNAVKFTPVEGHITLTLQKDLEYINIICKDNGIGMQPDKIESIFEVFTQIDTELHREGAGLGIGLALVKSLIEMHGGKVKAHSDGIGKGTEITISLPLVENDVINKEALLPQSQDTIQQTSHKRSILIAEDNIDLAHSLTTILQDVGHDVRSFQDGNQALTALQQECPDIIIIDIGLPGLDGYQLASKIRNIPALSKTILIGVSGYQQDKDKNNLFDHYIVKPINTNELINLIECQSHNKKSTKEGKPMNHLKLTNAEIRVLLIEDHPVVGEATLEELCEAGYNAIWEKTGDSAIEQAKTFKPQVILCDINLPDMNGTEVIKTLKLTQETQATIMVALSAHDLNEMEASLKKDGFDMALTKPLMAEDLEDVIKQIPEMNV